MCVRVEIRRKNELSNLPSRLSVSPEVITTDTDRSATYDFLLVISSNGLSRTVSEINGDCGPKNVNLSYQYHVY